MIFFDPKPSEVKYVCLNMGKKSRADILAASNATPEQYAKRIIFSDGFKWVAYHDGLPAALIGALNIHDGVWGLFGFGTDHWKKVWMSVTKVARKDMMQAVLETGAHRAQCMSPATHTDTHRWLERLGATHRVEMPAYGKNGEDYVMFAWLRGQ